MMTLVPKIAYNIIWERKTHLPCVSKTQWVRSRLAVVPRLFVVFEMAERVIHSNHVM